LGWNESLPITLNGEIVGPMGGFGWFLAFDTGSPVSLTLTNIQVTRHTHLLLVLPYPSSTAFTITANAASWCSSSSSK
jgi:hypothetical protein